MRDGKGIHVRYVPGTYRPLANKDNDYLMDRAAQKAGRTFSGVEGIAMQDASLQESMGPIVDRTKENLVSTDNGIIMARHRLLRAVKALVDKGAIPPGRPIRRTRRVRSAAIVLPPDLPFTEGAREALIARPGGRAGVGLKGQRSCSANQPACARPRKLRFRVQAPNSTPRATAVIALDLPGETLVRRLSEDRLEPRDVPQGTPATTRPEKADA